MAQQEAEMNKADWIQAAVANFEGRLLRYLFRWVPEADAREIVQESFLRLWQQDQEKIHAILAQWLFTVCRNQALDWHRREGNRAGGANVDFLPHPAASPELRLQEAGESHSLKALLSELPFIQQEVIRLKFQEDLSYKEISAITGHSVSYVGVLIHTAISQLRNRLKVRL
jgi:RNA polymerase sigma factor (sigma-70 family)